MRHIKETKSDVVNTQNGMFELTSLDPVKALGCLQADLHFLSESPVELERLHGAVLSQAWSVGHRPLPCRGAHEASGS